MDDLVLVYDKNNKNAGIFAAQLADHSKKFLGLNVQEPKPQERTSFNVAGQNIGIIVTPGCFTSEFVTDALELIVGAKKPTILIHDIASFCVLDDETGQITNDDYKRYINKAKSVTFTFDFADPCMDNLVEIMDFKSADSKTELKKQANIRHEHIQSDILFLSSKVAKARLNAAVRRKYDFCLTCVGDEVEETLQNVFESMQKFAPALQVCRNVGDKAITNMSQKTSNLRDSFNLIVICTNGCFDIPEDAKASPLLEEIKSALESELNVVLLQHIEQCPNLDEEIEKCQDLVLRSCLARAMRYVYLDGFSDYSVRGLLAAPADVKTDDNKTPRTRAAGVASFKLNYKNSQAMELAFDGRLSIYKTMLYEMKNKKVPGDVEGCVKGLFELYDTEKRGRITWAQFAEIDRLMVETLGGQYSEMISRRVYSLMLYPGLTLESEISYTTFYNYHSYIAKEMGIFDGESRDVGVHYKYISDKVKHMKKGKRFQKKYDLYITHDRTKWSREFCFALITAIRKFTPNIRVAICTDFDPKESDKDEKAKKPDKNAVKKEDVKNEAPSQSLNVIVLLKKDCMTNPVVEAEILNGIEGGAQMLVMCHIQKTPLLEREVKKASAEVQKSMSRLPVFCYSPDAAATCVSSMLDFMNFPDWKPVANRAKTFRKNENPMVLYLFQKCEEDEETTNALQAISNITSPSAVNAVTASCDFYKDGGFVILQEKFSNFIAVPGVCETACRAVANLAQGCGDMAEESATKMAEVGLIDTVVDAINQHVDNAWLQGEGCRAISSVAAQSAPAKKKVNDRQGFQLVLTSQKRNEDEANFWDGRFEMKRLAVGDALMVNYENQGRWISGTVLESYANGTYDVKYAHGGMGRRVPAHIVRPKDVSDKMLEFCSVWLWKPSGTLTEDELLIKPDGMVSLAASGQVGTWSVAERDDGRAAIKLQIGTLMIEMERISVSTMRATASPHRAVLRDEFRDCLNVQYFKFDDIEETLKHCGRSIPPLLGRKPEVMRLEQEINRKPGNGQPWTGLDMTFAEGFATRYSGKLIIRKMGEYIFEMTADSAASLRIGARSVVSGEKITLVAGAHTLRVDYCCRNGGAKSVILKYQGPDTNDGMVTIPAAALQHHAGSSDVVEKPGFIAEYYPVDVSESMQIPQGDADISRVEKQLDFDVTPDAWPRLPEKLYSSKGFSARYNGYITVNCGGKKKAMYKFILESNKRARLYLNDNLLIDTDKSQAEIELTKGQHLLQVEYYSVPGQAHGLKLKFSGPETLPKQTKEEADAEKAAWEEYEKLAKARKQFLDDPPEPEEGEEPPQPPPEPVKPAARVPEIKYVGPEVVSYFALDACCVPKGDPLEKHDKPVTAVAFSHDDGVMVSGSLGGKLMIWSYVTTEYQGVIDVGSPITCLAFPRPESIVPQVAGATTQLNLNVVAVGLENGNIVLYDVIAGTEVKTLTGHEGPVTSVMFHPCRGEDALKAVAADRQSSKDSQRRQSKQLEAPDQPTPIDGDVDPTQGAEGLARANSKEVRGAAIGSKPNLVSSSKDGTVRMWNTLAGEETTEEAGCLYIKSGKETISQLSVSIACDGSSCISGGKDGRLRYFDLEESDFVRGPQKELPLPPEPEEGWGEEGPPEPEFELGEPISFEAHKAPIFMVSWSPKNPRKMVTCSGDATVILWDMFDEAKEKLDPRPLMDPIQNLTSFCQWSPDTATFLCANEDMNVQLFSAVSGMTRTSPLPGHVAPVSCGAWAPLGQCLATSAADNTIRLWHFRLNRDIGEITILEKEQAEFNADMVFWQKLLDKIRKQFKDYNQWREYEPDIYLLRESLDKAIERTKSYNDRELLLGLSISDYYELDGMIDDYKPYFTLWDAVINFQKLQKLWHEQPMQSINAPKVEDQLDKWAKDCFKMIKEFSSDKMKNVRTTAKSLRDAIDSFKVKMPFLRAFSSEAVLQRHWDTLSERMGGKKPKTTDITKITMQEMLDIGVLDFNDDFEEISSAATKEFNLKRALASMKKDWEPITMVTKVYKNTGVPLLTGIDEIQAYLDDYIVKTQAIRSSPFCKPFEEEVHKWEATLLYIQDFVDETIMMQRSWMSLEPIFISDDIKRQLPHESEQFATVDAMFRRRMNEVDEDKNALRVARIQNLVEDIRAGNETIEKVQKGLKDYLETKRLYFPRFFFLNDADLLSILAETKDPTAVQPHLAKAFEGVCKVRFDSGNSIIESMISAEGEEIELKRYVDVNKPGNKGAVERWLVELEESMMDSLRVIIAESNQNYMEIERHQWCVMWPGQVAICTSCYYWTIQGEDFLRRKKVAEFEKKLFMQIANIVEMVRGEMTKLARITVGALVTLDVHARDVVTELKDHGIDSPEDFEWLAQLRYYWQEVGAFNRKDTQAPNEKMECQVSIVNSTLLYGFEYLGNTMRLVVTPLTDRCYRTLMGAFALYYGGAPEGPAGTGKTESTKDLAKALAVQCVVFNCSDSMDYLQLAKFFKGLAASGAWCCFDEFNRISLEVLSVVAQQIQQISLAIKQRVTTFVFEETELKLVPTCAVNITMNPGYAGRSELPDNLKALFRPCAMMVPNYALIAEIRLYSYGYEDAKRIGNKATWALKLSSEQLSPAKHYDFGMRGLTALLTAGGMGKRQYGDKYPEDVIALRSFTDVNLPKFVSADIPLFKGIIGDLFPGVKLPPADYGNLLVTLENVASSFGLQPCRPFINKTVQLWETVLVRHGLMTVGFPPCGKTCVKDVLATSLEKIADGGDTFMPVVQYVMNPKSITQGQLYGEADLNTQEWTDGVLAIAVRNASQPVGADGKMRRQWVVLDGPVDAIWIENMNTVLDDNKKLCLNSGEIIKLSTVTTMMFEVRDLEYASPATVSRVGIVYLEPDTDLGWMPIVQSWVETVPEFIKKHHKSQLLDLFTGSFEVLLECCRFIKTPVVVSDNWLALMACRLMESLMADQVMKYCRLSEEDMDGAGKDEDDEKDKKDKGPGPQTEQDRELIISQLYYFTLTWTIGACTDLEGRAFVDTAIRSLIEKKADFFKKNEFLNVPEFYDLQSGASLPAPPRKGLLHEFFIDGEDGGKWNAWTERIPAFEIAKGTPYHTIVVPTTDTERNQFLIRSLIEKGHNILISGPTGTAKTASINGMLLSGFSPKKYSTIAFAFSAQTTANQTQDIVDGKLDKRRKGVFGPPINKKMLVFIDDVNMPIKETYGAQPPIEILRQAMIKTAHGWGWYDRKNWDFRSLVDIHWLTAMGPPGGGKNDITDRYSRMFNLVFVTPFDDESLSRIFTTVVSAFFQILPRDVAAQAPQTVSAVLDVYTGVMKDFLPTPAKSHYTFNMRDVAKVFQGICVCTRESLPKIDDLCKVWFHECERVFRDRLVNRQDQTTFTFMMKRLMDKHFKRPYDQVVKLEPIIFTSFVDPKSVAYQEVQDHQKLLDKVQECLDDYNATSKIRLDLVLFTSFLEHIARLVRVLKLPLGNALLVGVGGSGRKSVTTLATYVADFTLFQIEIAKGYGLNEWHDDIKKLLISAGGANKNMVFLFPDTQIANETFLEEVSSVLNTGEVPNLYSNEDKMEIMELCAKSANAAGAVTPNEVFNWYVNNCRKNLHISLALSPIGADFRIRLRNFPSLVNCCTIDWFMEWPPQALTAVAHQFLRSVDMAEDVKDNVVQVMVEAQVSVTELAEKFYKNEKRIFYVTPTSYLELISSFIGMLKQQRQVVHQAKWRYDVGIEKIEEAAGAVAALQKDLEDLQPVLETSAKETSEMMIRVEGEQKKASEKQKLVDADAAAAEEEGRVAQEIKADCEKDLAAAMPALEAAVDALSKLSKGDIGEVKAMKTPPAGVVLTCQALCYMFDVKPVKVAAPDGKGKVDDYWEPAKKELLGDPRLLERMINFDKDNISEATIKKVFPLYESEAFDPDIIKKASIAAMGICKWVRAMVVYDKVAKEVGPKRAKLAKAEKAAADALALLSAKQAELAEVIALVNKLVAELDAAKAKMEELQNQSDECRAKLVRAEKLITGLGGEKTAWTANSNKLGQDYTNLTGDILIASGICAYLGCFTGAYRLEAVKRWLAKLVALTIPASAEFNLQSCIGDQVKIRQWVIDKLPNDSLSIDNAIILNNSRRWPLMIDPQNQANKWVKNTHKESLKILRLNQNYARVLETCISFGTPTLIENIGLTIDAMLNPLLLKATFKQGNQEMIRLGDSTIEYSKDFLLYFTTKLPNPHYAPEICVAACILNFMATADGLSDGMLGIIVAKEEPEIEQQRQDLVIQSAKSKAELAEIENKILALLSASSGDILEDEELIDTLSSSKITSTRIFEQVKVQEMTAATIAETRASYAFHSFRCAALFFVIADLRIVDPMYEFSLDWFITHFITSIDLAEAKETKDDRLQSLFSSCLSRMYDQVCRSLFAKDKLLYSFLLCLKCQETDKELNMVQVMALQTCLPGQAFEERPAGQDWLTDVSWNRVNTLSTLGDVFDGFVGEFNNNINGWHDVFDSDNPLQVEWPNNFKAKCNALQRALVMYAVRTDATILAIQEIVLDKLGRQYLIVPPFDLPVWFEDSTPNVALIFILSMGSDPMADVTNLAIKHDMLSKIVPISLGQGQGPKATAGIKDGAKTGKWVLLQNCHLGLSYMPTLEAMIEAWKPEDLHPAFRLWLTACPSPDFPIAVLQGAIKMTVEPPKGLRNSLQRAYKSMDEEWFESSTKPQVFKKMLFGLCFFHGLILERRAFGPIGWNIPYGFSEPDLDISQKQLRNFLEDFSTIPFAALNYMVAEANYGGRVTDAQDRRLIVMILLDYYTPKILESDYKFSVSGIYYSPEANTIAEHMEYIEALPLNHTPEVFWLHSNANLTASINEGTALLKNAVTLMNSFKGGAAGDDEEDASAKSQTPEEKYSEIADKIVTGLPSNFDVPMVMRKYPVLYEQCLNTVLLNELLKFNKLYAKIKDTCINLQKAVKGLVIFSPELEQVANGILTNVIPATWISVSYPSLKPLISYVYDFMDRVKWMEDWIKDGAPNVFWFSAYFFQQAFLTGVLQNFARSANIAIDKLMWNFEVMKEELTNPDAPEKGAYIRGLFMEGARWNNDEMWLADSFPKVLWSTIPLIWLKPNEIAKDEHNYKAMYACPVYKTSDRRGVLSTSGHSSNYIMYMYMGVDPSCHSEQFWTKRGVAMISQTDD